MSELYQMNVEIAQKMILLSEKNEDIILENHPQKLALQIDNDLRESLPPQMLSVVSGVLNLLRDLNIR